MLLLKRQDCTLPQIKYCQALKWLLTSLLNTQHNAALWSFTELAHVFQYLQLNLLFLHSTMICVPDLFIFVNKKNKESV